jgi:hypothetical protein
MPLNFNLDFAGPKIDIVTREVPIAAIEKVGDVLQDRYDKSIEQYNLADEALKQMEASANEVDKQKAKELRSYYNQEMQSMLQKGDFHNMRHQTAALARNAAQNYKMIGERNQLIQQQLDALTKDPRYRLDPEGARKDFLQTIKPININPETRTVSDFNVGAYNAAADADIADKFLKIAPTIRSTFKNSKGTNFKVETLPDGRKVIVSETVGGGKEILTAKDIADNLMKYVAIDPEVQAYINRDVKRMGIDPNSDEGKLAYNKLLQERSFKAAETMGTMYDIYRDNTQSVKNVIAQYQAPTSGGGFSPFENLENMQATQGTVDIDSGIQKQIDALTGSIDPAILSLVPTRDEFGVEDPNKKMLVESQKQNLQKLLPPNFYSLAKNKGLSDVQIRDAYVNHLNKLKKVVNTKYTFIDKEDQNAMKAAIKAGASGTRYVDSEGNNIDGGDLKWEDVDISFYPGKGNYSVTQNDKTYYPTTIDPNLQDNMKSAQELIYEFTDLSSDKNIVSVPTSYNANFKVAIVKTDVRPDGTYKGYVNTVVQTPDGKYQALPNQKISFDTKTEGITPEVINSKVRHLLKLSGQQKGIK